MMIVTCATCEERVEGLLDYENHARGHEADLAAFDARHATREGTRPNARGADCSAPPLSERPEWVRRASAGTLPVKEYHR